jgi:methionyl-tRNA formyltransferase
VAAALLNGDSETGVSIMRLAEGWDTGPVFRQRSVPIAPDDNAGTLTDKLAQLGADLLVEVVNLRVKGMITAKPQDESRASYAPKLSKSDGRIEWSKAAQRLARELRAYTPWPGSFTTWQGKVLKVLAGRVQEAPLGTALPPGTVLPGLAVVTGDGELVLEQVQLEGRRAMSAEEFVRGQPAMEGAQLGSLNP